QVLKSDFPGHWFPTGYELVDNNVEFEEEEDQLDFVIKPGPNGKGDVVTQAHEVVIPWEHEAADHDSGAGGEGEGKRTKEKEEEEEEEEPPLDIVGNGDGGEGGGGVGVLSGNQFGPDEVRVFSLDPNVAHPGGSGVYPSSLRGVWGMDADGKGGAEAETRMYGSRGSHSRFLTKTAQWLGSGGESCLAISLLRPPRGFASQRRMLQSLLAEDQYRQEQRRKRLPEYRAELAEKRRKMKEEEAAKRSRKASMQLEEVARKKADSPANLPPPSPLRPLIHPTAPAPPLNPQAASPSLSPEPSTSPLHALEHTGVDAPNGSKSPAPDQRQLGNRGHWDDQPVKLQQDHNQLMLPEQRKSSRLAPGPEFPPQVLAENRLEVGPGTGQGEGQGHGSTNMSRPGQGQGDPMDLHVFDAGSGQVQVKGQALDNWDAMGPQGPKHSSEERQGTRGDALWHYG
ncbi:unnamed protein product, partial [Discosporangium mesarthrocarpum]